MGCANGKIECPVGCGQVNRGAFQAHCKRKAGFHLQWLFNHLATIEKIITKTTPNGDIQRITGVTNLLREKVEELERKIQLMASSRISRGKSPNEKDTDSIGRRCQTLELTNVLIEDIVTTLHGEIHRCIVRLENLERHRVTSEEKIAENERKIRQFLSDIAISAIEIRVKSLEITSYDGIFIWKIPDWSRHRRDAVNGEVTCISSTHFFTSGTGYRLCARLYPNGDGMGKNTHISTFFVIVRGFYDALLSWPFSHRVTFMLIDQNNRDHMIDSFRPDPTSSSFKRPTTDMNIPIGCPFFMPLSKLDNKNSAYVKDDVMFIKVSVESPDGRGAGSELGLR